MRSKLNEGYTKGVLNRIDAVLMNDKPLAVRRDKAIAISLVYNDMFVDPANRFPDHLFTNGWLTTATSDQENVYAVMNDLLALAGAYRDRKIAAGADENAYAISVEMQGFVLDVGRINCDQNEHDS